MYCKSCGAVAVGKYCSCCGARVWEEANAQRPYVDVELFGRTIDVMCRYGISAEALAKIMGVTKHDIFRIVGHGAFSEDAVRFCNAVGTIAIPLIKKRHEEFEVRLRQMREGRRKQ